MTVTPPAPTLPIVYPPDVPEVTVPMADDYFSYTLRDAQWQAVTSKQIALYESQIRLLECNPDPSKTTCGDNFAGQWTAAVSELALALFTSQSAVITSSPANSTDVKLNKLGDLEQEFYSRNDGMANRYGASAPTILQKFPWLGDIIGCWLTKSGSNVLNRYRS